MRKLLMSAAVLAAAAVATPSNAAVAVDFFGGGSVTASGFSVFNDFNDASDLTDFTGSSYGILPASPNSEIGAAPYYGDNTSYLSVFANGSASVDLPAVSFFAFDVGSLDSFNKMTVFYTEGGLSKSLIYIPSNPADGNWTNLNTNGLLTVTGTDGIVFKSVTFESRANSFEIDNLAVPEASTWAMMLVGLGAVGFAMRRQKVSVSFA